MIGEWKDYSEDKGLDNDNRMTWYFRKVTPAKVSKGKEEAPVETKEVNPSVTEWVQQLAMMAMRTSKDFHCPT